MPLLLSFIALSVLLLKTSMCLLLAVLTFIIYIKKYTPFPRITSSNKDSRENSQEDIFSKALLIWSKPIMFELQFDFESIKNTHNKQHQHIIIHITVNMSSSYWIESNTHIIHLHKQCDSKRPVISSYWN